MPNPILIEQVRLVATARRSEASLKAVLDAKRQAFEAANADILQSLRVATITRETAEDALRHSAFEHVRDTGDTKPAPGVGSRAVTTVEVVDEPAAMEWAKKTGFCLQLDRKALEAVAKHHTDQLPFVKVTEARQITLAKDLDAALATAELIAGSEVEA